MPEDIASRLARTGLRAAHDARPPYQRNDWLAWFAQAKRHGTREKRISSMLRELDQGHGYMGMDRRPRT